MKQNWYTNLEDARQIITAWRMDYNTVRPHSSLGYLTPEEYAAEAGVRPGSPPTPVVPVPKVWKQTVVQQLRSVNLRQD